MSTYGAKLRARLDLRYKPAFGSAQRCLPVHVLDAIADAKMNQGYTKRRNPICPQCFTQKSNSGICGCNS